MNIHAINPTTGQEICTYPQDSLVDCKQKVAYARLAFSAWSQMPAARRGGMIKKLGDVLRTHANTYAELMTQEMGKPIRQSLAEVEKCAWVCDYYAEHGEAFLTDEIIKTEAHKSYVTFEPLGVILAVMPWNFPFWQVFRAAVPAVLAGNVCILKHASNVPGCALAIEHIFSEAGFPKHVFTTLLADAATITALLGEDLFEGVTLTGSNAAGSKVAGIAGQNIRKVVLELGGSDPFIVLADATIAHAAKTGVIARTINSGQSCIAAKRFIVSEDIAPEFEAQFMDQFFAQKVGDPSHAETDIGPLARKEACKELEAVLLDAQEKGATVVRKGTIPSSGYFFQPAVILGAKSTMRCFTEEVFGPIAPILRVKTEEEMITIANATEYGLGASIWSSNIERAEQLAKKLHVGCVAINDLVKSDPRLPFGGTKKSGLGRELSWYALKEFVNVKTVVVQKR